jgi:glucose dehydrogenase
VVLAGCSSTTSTPAGNTVTNPQAARPAGSWLYPNGDPENTRDAAGATISSANVAGLQQAWTFKLPSSLVTSGPGFGSLAATPIVANGVVYLQDLGGNVYALALRRRKAAVGVPGQLEDSRGRAERRRARGRCRVRGHHDHCVRAQRRHWQNYLGRPGAAQQRALNLTTGKVEWDTKVPAYPLGAATVSNHLVFTTLYTGVLIALDRATGAIVYQRKLPTSANAPIAIAGNSVLVPAGGPNVFGPKGGSPQLVVYTVR